MSDGERNRWPVGDGLNGTSGILLVSQMYHLVLILA